MFGAPVDLSFKNITYLSGAMLEEPQSGLRPLKTNSEKKYLSRSLRLNNNRIGDLKGLQYVLRHFLARPLNLGWLDLSFNKIRSIDPVLCELSELRVLYLHGNNICNLSEVDKLGELQHLHTITLHGNSIEDKGYRNHVISVLPHLKSIDFSAVTPEEQALANVWHHCVNHSKEHKGD
ncbi:Leucine-rich repeat-containing protein 51 [Channa argus]|uniref:Leucine-rich repeat-containing protein 51 n=1 Tax=Channa argus TaxID=215402 RepID=A0A6G1QPL3_CHAAH|nr:Leucine-rich repeat-containing protein 51 [Channa argus]KAK2884762.1 hypothetical protein Q8A73_021236 [Channa argus]